MTNVFCILISILKYKIHDKSISNTKYKILFPNVFQIKYKIHAKYFKYVFQIHVFQILPNTDMVTLYYFLFIKIIKIFEIN
jgi:hypothetical protein